MWHVVFGAVDSWGKGLAAGSAAGSRWVGRPRGIGGGRTSGERELGGQWVGPKNTESRGEHKLVRTLVVNPLSNVQWMWTTASKLRLGGV